MAWRVLSRQQILDCSPWLRVYREAVLLEDGLTVVPDYYQIEAVPFVIVFPVMEGGHIALIQLYRHAVGGVSFDLPGGNLDPSEDPSACAQRELLEETGLEAERMEHLATLKMSGVRAIADAYCFMAHDCRFTTQPQPGDLQAIEVVTMPPVELLDLWRSGGWPILNTAAIVGIGLGRLGVIG